VAQPVSHAPVCLIVGMISAHDALFDRATDALVSERGPVLLESRIMPFDFTDYYAPEMGESLQRKFLVFARPFDAERLPEIKRRTNDLEDRLAGPDYPVRRPINLDPGYITLSKLVLATTKDHAHRIYLRDGIYAEITLSYVGGAYRAHPWTYPDYRSPDYLAFFESVRRRIKAEGFA